MLELCELLFLALSPLLKHKGDWRPANDAQRKAQVLTQARLYDLASRPQKRKPGGMKLAPRVASPSPAVGVRRLRYSHNLCRTQHRSPVAFCCGSFFSRRWRG